MEDNWKTGFVRSGPVLLEYKMQTRAGRSWFVFFHGYGQDFRAFQPVYERLGSEFSLLAIHLPWHGESKIESDEVLSKDQWAACLEHLFLQLGTGPVRAMAFSMGAKFLLSAAEKKPELFEEMILLAPDGMAMNPWYRLATGITPGRTFLKLSLRLFPIFRSGAFVLSRLGLVRKALMRFAFSELGTEQGRNRVLAVWIQFRKLWPDLSMLKIQCREKKIPVSVFLGRYDGILTLSRYKKIRSQTDWINWEEMNTGHAGLIEEFARHGLR